MGVAKRDVGNGNLLADFGPGRGNGEIGIGERRAADLVENCVPDHELTADAEPFANVAEGLLLARFGALAVADVQSGDVLRSEIADGEGGADAGIHAATEYDDSLYRLQISFAHNQEVRRPLTRAPK